MSASPLVDMTVSIRVKLSALWAALMFCYICGDYFGLYVPGKLSGVINSDGPIGRVSQSALIIPSILLAVPGLMVFLSLVFPAAICRWANIVLGGFYIAVMALTMPGTWGFYILLWHCRNCGWATHDFVCVELASPKLHNYSSEPWPFAQDLCLLTQAVCGPAEREFVALGSVILPTASILIPASCRRRTWLVRGVSVAHTVITASGTLSLSSSIMPSGHCHSAYFRD